MITAHRPTAHDRLLIAMAALGVLALASVAFGSGDALFLDKVVKGIHWLARYAGPLRTITDGILKVAVGLAKII